MTWIIIGIDIASMFILLVTICLIPSSVVKRTNFYNLSKILISDFSIHLMNLNLKGLDIYEEISEVLGHIKKVLEAEDKMYVKGADNLSFYEINFPMITNTQVDFLVEKTEIETEIQILNAEIDKNGASEELSKKIADKETKLKELKFNLMNLFKEELLELDDLFITFTSRRQKKLFKELYNVSAVKRCCSNSYQHL